MRSLIATFLLMLIVGSARAADAPQTYWKPYFRGMKEPVLPSAQIADGDFQFRWTRLSASGGPLSVRVWQTKGQTSARAVRLQFRPDYSVGRITRAQTIRLTEQQVARVRSHFAAESFWRPLNKVEREFQGGFLGGAHWLFELQDASGYHFISMFSPPLFLRSPDPPKIPKGMRSWSRYVSAANFLLRTTNIFPDEHEANY